MIMVNYILKKINDDNNLINNIFKKSTIIMIANNI